MKQVQFSSFGQPSAVAKLVDVPELDGPAAWEVIVDVEAFPINVADLAMLSGRYGTLPKPPATIGMEAVGTIRSCGSAVKDFSHGDRVVLLGNNNWAEQRKVPAATVVKAPADLDALQLSMLKVNPTTAHLMLTNFEQLEPGDWILQNAPLGSVGQCVIQIAKALGYRTINIVRRREAEAEVRALGGDVVIHGYDDLATAVRQYTGHDPIMLALDAVAGSQVNHLADTVSDNGTVVNYGMLSGEPCQISPENTIFKGVKLQGFWLSKLLNRFNQQQRNELYSTILRYFTEKNLNISIDSVFSLSEIGDALRKSEAGSRTGKVVVTTNSYRPA